MKNERNKVLDKSVDDEIPMIDCPIHGKTVAWLSFSGVAVYGDCLACKIAQWKADNSEFDDNQEEKL